MKAIAIVMVGLGVLAAAPATTANAAAHKPGTCVNRTYKTKVHPAHLVQAKFHARHFVATHTYVRKSDGARVTIGAHWVKAHTTKAHIVPAYTTLAHTITTCY